MDSLLFIHYLCCAHGTVGLSNLINTHKLIIILYTVSGALVLDPHTGTRLLLPLWMVNSIRTSILSLHFHCIQRDSPTLNVCPSRALGQPSWIFQSVPYQASCLGSYCLKWRLSLKLTRDSLTTIFFSAVQICEFGFIIVAYDYSVKTGVLWGWAAAVAIFNEGILGWLPNMSCILLSDIEGFLCKPKTSPLP